MAVPLLVCSRFATSYGFQTRFLRTPSDLTPQSTCMSHSILATQPQQEPMHFCSWLDSTWGVLLVLFLSLKRRRGSKGAVLLGPPYLLLESRRVSHMVASQQDGANRIVGHQAPCCLSYFNSWFLLTLTKLETNKSEKLLPFWKMSVLHSSMLKLSNLDNQEGRLLHSWVSLLSPTQRKSTRPRENELAQSPQIHFSTVSSLQSKCGAGPLECKEHLPDKTQSQGI